MRICYLKRDIKGNKEKYKDRSKITKYEKNC